VESPWRPSDEATEEERQAPCVPLWQAWEASLAPVQPQLAKGRSRVAPGVFVGGEAADCPEDHWDVERWFKRPNGHERRMHGRRHGGVRLVQHGPTRLLALDAPGPHEGPCTGDALAPDRHSRVPARQQEALRRGKIMRKARSRKNRHDWLADLEKRYLNSS